MASLESGEYQARRPLVALPPRVHEGLPVGQVPLHGRDGQHRDGRDAHVAVDEPLASPEAEPDEKVEPVEGAADELGQQSAVRALQALRAGSLSDT